MARVISALVLAAAASAAPVELIQTDGVSSAVAAQVKLVQKIISQLQQEHRKVSGPEKETLQLVDDTLAKTTLPNIDAAHDADVKLLDEGIATIKACDDDLKETTGIDAAKKASDDAQAALKECRSKEAELLTFSQGEQKKLDAFIQGTSKGPQSCDLPAPTKLDENPDGMGDFFKSTKTWFAQRKKTLAQLVDNAAKAAAAHKTKAAECNDEKQPDYESKYCVWASEVTEKRNAYAACRASTEKEFDQTFDDVTVKSGHRKSDFKAVNRVRCLLKVLMMDGSADDADGALKKCLDAEIDASKFTIAKAPYPDQAKDALAGLGDLSSPPTDCKPKA